VLGVTPSGEPGLELGHFRPEHEIPVCQHARDRRVDPPAQPRPLRLEIDEPDGRNRSGKE
jgi:hypothetical protein